MQLWRSWLRRGAGLRATPISSPAQGNGTIAFGKRRGRPVPFKAFARQAALPILAAIAIGIAYGTLMRFSPWDQLTTLRHAAAFPNCGMARLVGLAPAYRGSPGYYTGHDRDRDGWACEPLPSRLR